MQGHLREDLSRISTRSSVKDLYRIMQEPLKEEFSRISTRARLREMYNENAPDQDLENPASQTLCDPAQSKCTYIAKGHLYECENYRKNAGGTLI
jgi:hypothetical protein